MRKKISKILALSMAMALTFGMTVSAAPSPSTETAKVVINETVTVAADTTEPADTAVVAELQAEAATLNSTVGAVSATLKVDGKDVAVTVAAPKPVAAGVLNSAKTTAAKIVADLVAESKITVETGKTAVATPIAAADVEVTLPAGVTKEALAKTGISLTIPVSNLKVEAGKNYMLLHLRADGIWETIPVTNIVDGAVTATFTSLSPIVVIEVSAQTAPAAEADSAAVVSPKTGETAPFAAVFAIICLAGAAICVKKVTLTK